MDEQTFKDLLRKHEQGTATDEELRILDAFDRELLRRFGDKVFRDEKHKAQLLRSQWRSIEHAIHHKTVQHNDKQTDRSLRPLMRYAAILVVLVVSVGIWQYDIFTASSNDWVILETKAGERAQLTLPDGSDVWLNNDSRIEFSRSFTTREISLEGEAFFEVIHEPERPFVVQTDNLKTRVLGTTFNIRAYPDQNQILVTLESGKVVLTAPDSQMLLAPAQQAAFQKEQKSLTKQNVALSKHLLWREGVLRFDHSTLEEAMKEIERWYGVQIVFENDDLLDCRISGTFHNTPLNVVLDNIKFTKSGMQYRIEPNNKIILYGNCIP